MNYWSDFLRFQVLWIISSRIFLQMRRLEAGRQPRTHEYKDHAIKVRILASQPPFFPLFLPVKSFFVFQFWYRNFSAFQSILGKNNPANFLIFSQLANVDFRHFHDSGSCNQGSNPCFPATLFSPAFLLISWSLTACLSSRYQLKTRLTLPIDIVIVRLKSDQAESIGPAIGD